jgi:hypothetical protein
MVICLGWPSPATSSSLPAAHRCRCCRCGPHLAAYLALLRLGVAVPLAVARSAVGSYPTVSPLPHLREAVCFLWPCPSPLGAQALPGSLPVGARTFLEKACALPRPSRPTRRSKIRDPRLPRCPHSLASHTPFQPRQPCLRLLHKGQQRPIGSLPGRYDLLELPARSLGFAKLLVGEPTQQVHPAHDPPA